MTAKRSGTSPSAEPWERGQTANLLSLQSGIAALLDTHRPMGDTVADIVSALKQAIGFDAVGLRLAEGDDYPFVASLGYSDDFLKTENTLTISYPDGGLCRDEEGSVSLECTCGLVLQGKTDPADPLYTPGGSAWTNDSLALLDVPAEEDPRLHPRNRCIHVGFRSLALVPLRAGQEILGLLHLADRRTDRFTPETVQFFEGIGVGIGMALRSRHTEKALRESEAKLRLTIDEAPIGVVTVGLDLRFWGANKAFCNFLGYDEEELKHKTIPGITFPDDVEIGMEDIRGILAGEEKRARVEKRYVRADGAVVWGQVDMGLARDDEGRPGYFLTIVQDITERREAEEERLRLERRVEHSRRLESLGVLAGGVAHDFNNILTSILGNAELTLAELPASAPGRDNLHEIVQASHRAAALAQQMLAYSGRGRKADDIVELGGLVGGMLGELKSSISGNARLDVDLAPDLPFLTGDPGQIRQVLTSLIANASEAMGDKEGVITVSAQAMECSAEYLRSLVPGEDLVPGLYLALRVADTGIGMDAETQARLFEPFFTTKFAGRGLGLCAVLGVVRGHGGAIMVDSVLGRGTTFTILLPAEPAKEAAQVRPSAPPEGTEWRAWGTALLVDDEEIIRTVGARLLSRLGFVVLTAADGAEALSIYTQHRHEISVILLDLTMPNMGGQETFFRLRTLNPRVRVVMSSGYAEQDLASDLGGDHPPDGFVQKPYTLAELRAKLRKALER